MIIFGEINREEKMDFINNRLNMLPIHGQLSKLDLNITQMDFDARSLYPSAMWDEKSFFLKWKLGLLLNLI